MTVLFVGASHATAPLALIEQLSFSVDDAAALLARITPDDLRPAHPFRELVLLSTCHRVELYAVTADDSTRPSAALDAMAGLLATRNADIEGFDAHVRRLVGTEATRHPGLPSSPCGGKTANPCKIATPPPFQARQGPRTR